MASRDGYFAALGGVRGVGMPAASMSASSIVIEPSYSRSACVTRARWILDLKKVRLTSPPDEARPPTRHRRRRSA